MTTVAIGDDDDKVAYNGNIIVTTYHHKQKKTQQLSLTAALSMIEQSSNAEKGSNSSSKYFEGTGASLVRPSLHRQRQHLSKHSTMLSSVHLDCSKANVGTLTGIAEGATVSL